MDFFLLGRVLSGQAFRTRFLFILHKRAQAITSILHAGVIEDTLFRKKLQPVF